MVFFDKSKNAIFQREFFKGNFPLKIARFLVSLVLPPPVHSCGSRSKIFQVVQLQLLASRTVKNLHTRIRCSNRKCTFPHVTQKDTEAEKVTLLAFLSSPSIFESSKRKAQKVRFSLACQNSSPAHHVCESLADSLEIWLIALLRFFNFDRHSRSSSRRVQRS